MYKLNVKGAQPVVQGPLGTPVWPVRGTLGVVEDVSVVRVKYNQGVLVTITVSWAPVGRRGGVINREKVDTIQGHR